MRFGSIGFALLSSRGSAGLAALSVLYAPALALGGLLTVVSTVPARHTMAMPATAVSVTFDQPVLPASFTSPSFYAFGKSSGLHPGTFEFTNGDRTVTLRPQHTFAAGELVLVVLSNALRASDNTPLREAGYSFTFLVRTKPADMDFAEIDSLSNRGDPPVQTRIYGAAAGDFNGDGWTDLCTVNEVSTDLRLLVNRADGTGRYDGPLEPFAPIGEQASPNDTADFNFDGKLDVCVGNTMSQSVSVVLGNGDGTFVPETRIPTGAWPYGVVSFDMDGDGDMDIACAASGGNRVYLMRNDGDGTFAAAVAYEAGFGEYGLAFGDMNSDGIMDLIVGESSSDRVSIHRGNGNGTFSQTDFVSCGGAVWVVAAGDLNGDGHLDVSTANSSAASGGILFGDGAGNLSSVTTYASVGYTPSTDLGDLDGDGDLDWVLSSFSGGIWRLYENNGSGAFSFAQDFTADNNPSCAVLLDIDNDRDLDLVLTDEIADVVKLLQNSGVTPNGDTNCSGTIDFFDIDPFIVALLNPAGYASQYPNCRLIQADCNSDGSINFFDIDLFLAILF